MTDFLDIHASHIPEPESIHNPLPPGDYECFLHEVSCATSKNLKLKLRKHWIISSGKFAGRGVFTFEETVGIISVEIKQITKIKTKKGEC